MSLTIMKGAAVRMNYFDLEAAQKGYALNKMCFSLNDATNRAAFIAAENDYCARYGLSEAACAAVRARDKQKLMELGGNMYFLAKLDRVARPQAAAPKEPTN